MAEDDHLPDAAELLAIRLASIRRRILAQSAVRLQELLGLLAAAARGELEPQDREAAYRLAHNFGGTAGSVGLDGVGLAAKQLAQAIGPWLLHGEEPAPDWPARLQALAEAVISAQQKYG